MLRLGIRTSLTPLLLPLALPLLAACGGADLGGATSGDYTPPPTGGPGTPAPTGQKWDGQPSKDKCGRNGWTFRLVDEICGGTGSPGYLDTLRTPMTRDGTIVGKHLFAVDATHLWVIALDGTELREVARVAGLGQPLSIAQHAGRLVLASGATGLVVVDPADPTEPAVLSVLPLPGPALDVAVEGDRAIVAMGAAGFAVVALGDPPSIAFVRDTPGFAAGATLKDGVAYVADCAALGVFDGKDGTLWSYASLDQTSGTGVDIPYRDVEVRDGTAYVAAGRWGVVRFDVSNPVLLGKAKHCRIDAPNFYASGVRSSEAGVYLAGGEWGITRADGGCTGGGATNTPPMPLPTDAGTPELGSGCPTVAPWDVVVWAASTPVPSPNKDPVQVLVTPDRVYAFGEATRLGFRAIDERDPALTLLRRWEEPLWATSVAARAGRVFVAGRRAALFDVGADGALTKHETTFPDAVSLATAAGLLPDGRWAFVAGTALWVEGVATPFMLPRPVYGFGVAETSDGLVFAGAAGLVRLSVAAGGAPTLMPVPLATTKLPAAVAAAGGTLYMGAPEWDHTLRWAKMPADMPPHGVFTAAQAADTAYWVAGLPRRVLMTAGQDLVEVAMLADRAGIVAPGRFEGVLPFPREEVVGGVASETRAYVLATDRKGYTTRLHTIRLDPPAIVAAETWLGQGMGIARSEGRIYVADANGTLRVFGMLGDALVQEQLVALEAKP